MEHDPNGYTLCMEEIKRRTNILDEALTIFRQNGTVSVPNCELSCLQLRKIYELLAFSSLSANREKYARLRSSFEKDWDINRITKIIENLNPNFLPIAITEIEAEKDGVRYEIIDDPSQKFTRGELVKRHGQLSQMLHAFNPYRKVPDYAHWLMKASEWRDDLVATLNVHRVDIERERIFYRVAMDTLPDGDVQVAVMVRKPEELSP